MTNRWKRITAGRARGFGAAGAVAGWPQSKGAVISNAAAIHKRESDGKHIGALTCIALKFSALGSFTTSMEDFRAILTFWLIEVKRNYYFR